MLHATIRYARNPVQTVTDGAAAKDLADNTRYSDLLVGLQKAASREDATGGDVMFAVTALIIIMGAFRF